MTERNTDNSDARQSDATASVGMGAEQPSAGALVQAQIEANERARKILESKQDAGAVAEQATEAQAVTANAQGATAGAAATVATAAEEPAKNKKKSTRAKKSHKKTTGNTESEPRGMAEINFAKKSALARSFAEYKKIWIGAGAAIAVLILVVVGVVIGVKLGRPEEIASADVSLADAAEWYGGDPATSMLATVFGEQVEEKLKTDESYTYEDAVMDYEVAYEESEGQLQTEVSYSYAYFVYNNTGNLNEALDVLRRIEGSLSGVELVEYYSTVANLYKMAGDTLMAEQYTAKVEEYAAKYSLPADTEYLMQILELE